MKAAVSLRASVVLVCGCPWFGCGSDPIDPIDPRWDDPVRIEDSEGFTEAAHMAAGGDGSVMVVWRASDGNAWQGLWVNRRTPSGDWETAERLDGPLLTSELAISLDGVGNAVVVSDVVGAWDEGSVAVHPYDVGTGWGQVALADGPGHVFGPQLAMNSRGEVLVAWVSLLDSQSVVRAMRFDVDTGWSAPEDIGESAVLWPRAGLDDSGNAIVAWQGLTDVLAARYVDGVGWEPPVSIGIEGEQVWWLYALAMDRTGRCTVLWELDHAPLYASRFDPAEGWAAPEVVVDRYVPDADVAVDGQGNVVAVWKSWDTERGIFARRFDAAAGAWQDTATIGAGPADGPVELSMNASGDAIVGWMEPSGVWANTLTGDEWDAPGMVQAGLAGFDVAIDPEGRAFATWHEGYEGGSDVWAVAER